MHDEITLEFQQIPLKSTERYFNFFPTLIALYKILKYHGPNENLHRAASAN